MEKSKETTPLFDILITEHISNLIQQNKGIMTHTLSGIV